MEMAECSNRAGKKFFVGIGQNWARAFVTLVKTPRHSPKSLLLEN